MEKKILFEDFCKKNCINENKKCINKCKNILENFFSLLHNNKVMYLMYNEKKHRINQEK